MLAKPHSIKTMFASLTAVLVFLISLAVAPVVSADPLDTVLDVLYKAGVIDGNVKAAKPLISCLADGKNVADCTAGAADQSEFADDPQVKNVIDIYQAFRAQDYYTVLKKSGITVGCALIPGGEVKDVLCGELGKIAAAVLDGVGSVLGAVGSFVVSMFGGGSDPPPISPQDYYTLNFMPWYHWSVVYQLDNNTPSNNQILNAPIAACVDYFYHHTYSKDDANKVCGDMRIWLNNAGYAIGNAFRDETDSYYQLHFAPKIEEWALMSFNKPGTIDSLASGAMANCLYNERKKIPLPEPGFEQCQAMDPNAVNPVFKDIVVQLQNQCMALATQRSVPKDNDAYTRICTPITNRVSGKIILAMAELKSRMDAAAAAGCPNNGTPKSIHCDTYQTHNACVIKLQPYASWCALDQGKAISNNVEQIWAAINTEDAPCTAYGDTHSNLACPHPLQQMHCSQAKKAIEDAWGSSAVSGITCDALDDPAYQQLKQQATQVLAVINADYQTLVLHAQAQVLMQVAPTVACQLARHDPLVITCAENFQIEASPERAAAVYEAINANNQAGRPRPIYCLPDVDNDGAEAPCIEGQAGESPESNRRPLLIRQIAPVIKNGEQ